MTNNKYIRFDWAAKSILRDKANFCILEGLITVLLGENVEIVELLESESNQQREDDKFNRVDIKAKNSKGEIIIVEIQQTREIYYLERILYGVAKAITEHIHLGNKYDQVKKVYSINILYFDLGKGKDYIYRGQTSFVGVNTNDTLEITTKEKEAIDVATQDDEDDTLQVPTKEKEAIRMKTPEEVFPEYYLIRVNAFDKIAQTHLEEWMRYFKDGDIDENTTAPGLMEAKRKLEYINMSESERHAYDEHINAIMIQNDVLSANWQEGLAVGRARGIAEGRAEGRAEGIAEGRAEGRAEGEAIGLEKGRAEGERQKALAIAVKLKFLGLTAKQIAEATGLTEVELEAELN